MATIRSKNIKRLDNQTGYQTLLEEKQIEQQHDVVSCCWLSEEDFLIQPEHAQQYISGFTEKVVVDKRNSEK